MPILTSAIGLELPLKQPAKKLAWGPPAPA
jgi:hypothetical protein